MLKYPLSVKTELKRYTDMGYLKTIIFKNVNDLLTSYIFCRYYSLLIFLMGFVIPLTLGALSSATITFVYKASSFRMDETHAMMWGSGQTVVHAAFGITRILATL